ncbi:hypothetical protein ACH5RR_029476 [Cinchona calisaya]|uniref:RNase H type-1 domain-containing protein n=1 Tax=Cinchona calisaya TaxID=153742 RepID=A0ABD2YVA7_9GENT
MAASQQAPHLPVCLFAAVVPSTDVEIPLVSHSAFRGEPIVFLSLKQIEILACPFCYAFIGIYGKENVTKDASNLLVMKGSQNIVIIVSRTSMGIPMVDFALSFGFASNIEAESLAFLGGIRLYLDKHLFPIIVETDSQTLCDMILGKSRVPLPLNAIISRAKYFMSLNVVQIVHSIRKANTIVDALASYASSSRDVALRMVDKGTLLGSAKILNPSHIQQKMYPCLAFPPSQTTNLHIWWRKSKMRNG